MNLPLKIAAFLALVAVIVLAAKSLLKEQKSEQPAPRPYTVKTMDIEQSVYGSGILRCSRRAEIVSRVTGRIRAEDLFVEEEDAVAPSQVLCKITNKQMEKDHRQKQDECTIAQHDYTDAEEEYENKKRTHEEHGVPSEKELQRLDRDLQRKKLVLQKAEEAVETLKEKIGYLTVKCPLAGTVLRSHLKRSELNLDPERTYPEGTPLFVVGDLTSLAVYGTILESDRSKVEQGDEAVVQCGKKGWLPAKVTRLSLIPSAASEGGRYEIQLDFDDPPSGLNEGLTVDFRVIVEKRGNILAVPVEYVKPDRGRHWVKKVAGDKVSRVEIEVGISSAAFYEVRRGLKEGDTILWDAEGKE
ncbi:efflux RND transporter periplasmic adaptor subunit [bacterium]|nr:efflux RND transporter periplasmic adaptor subunit [bacterium]